MSDKAERMRALNDQLRTTFVGGAVMITQGVEAIPIPRRKLILEQVRQFSSFTEDNDPHGEHDCAILEAEGEKIMFKIDYYDRDVKFHSPDPTDPTVTTRVLTIMRADEY